MPGAAAPLVFLRLALARPGFLRAEFTLGFDVLFRVGGFVAKIEGALQLSVTIIIFVVIIAGSPPGLPGSTNALRIHRMGDAINEVAPAYRRR